jgi:hypothetical protein
MTPVSATDARAILEARLASAAVRAASIDMREYPDETIFVVGVAPSDYERAIAVGNAVDVELQDRGFSGFVTIRRADVHSSNVAAIKRRGVSDPRATDLANLLTARSRTSEASPSLSYIPDAANNLSAITTARNHLVFGRRGAGKTTLMVEAKRSVEAQGYLTVWVNIQTYRHEGPFRTFAWVSAAVCERLQIHFKDVRSRVLMDLEALRVEIEALLTSESTDRVAAQRLIPRVRRLLERAVGTAGARLFIFLDDLHYLRREDQPDLLDMVHGITRDIDAWMKVASIRHLSRWFRPSPPTGLQSGHDADHIDLDLTLESPSEAKKFLDSMIDNYAVHAGLGSARGVLSEEALNRLVLAAGAVPRDYMIIGAGAIRQARKRSNSRYAGVQDVNRAVGDQSKVKLAELEDDAASIANGGAESIIAALNVIRAFCLDDKRYTFFRIDFRDKEMHPAEYATVQSLLDVRILHLVASSLSDKDHAGRRSEVFMLDLSQFSGQRLKKFLTVLDFVAGTIVLKRTTSSDPSQVGDTARKLQDLLRRGPEFGLDALGKTNVASSEGE